MSSLDTHSLHYYAVSEYVYHLYYYYYYYFLIINQWYQGFVKNKS